jgi:hypothetical protein
MDAYTIAVTVWDKRHTNPHFYGLIDDVLRQVAARIPVNSIITVGDGMLFISRAHPFLECAPDKNDPQIMKGTIRLSLVSHMRTNDDSDNTNDSGNIIHLPPPLELVRDTGVLIENFKQQYDLINNYNEFVLKFIEAAASPQCLGNTKGGTTGGLTGETRMMEYDGRRVRSIGDFTVDASQPQIKTVLLSHSVNNLKRVMPMSDIVRTGAKTTIRPRLGAPDPEDYMASLSWVRETANGDFTVFTIFNAINASGFSQVAVNKGEGEIPVTFLGCAGAWDDATYAPAEEILFRRG